MRYKMIPMESLLFPVSPLLTPWIPLRRTLTPLSACEGPLGISLPAIPESRLLAVVAFVRAGARHRMSGAHCAFRCERGASIGQLALRAAAHWLCGRLDGWGIDDSGPKLLHALMQRPLCTATGFVNGAGGVGLRCAGGRSRLALPVGAARKPHCVPRFVSSVQHHTLCFIQSRRYSVRPQIGERLLWRVIEHCYWARPMPR